jgi:hypothetical protein
MDANERLLRAERHAGLRRRVALLVDGPGFHDNTALVVDQDLVERAVELLERVLAGEKVAVRIGTPPPVATPGRKRGFALKDEGEGEE